MKLTDYVQFLLALCSITAIVVVGRSNIKKQIISDLQALVLAHEQTINRLKLENLQLQQDSAEKDGRIRALEETIDGYSELVRAGYLAGSGGTRSRNRPASTKTP
jgi:cell division protein FtsL